MTTLGASFSTMSYFHNSSKENSQPASFDLSAAFDISDCILLDDETLMECPPPALFEKPVPIELPVPINVNPRSNNGARIRREQELGIGDEGYRIAFRTMSEVDIMDDGYKWRKYGKKSLKNSPNPRNYYRCSTGGCSVKKRVERDGDDPRYVITSYEGIHNHTSPSVAYYTAQDDGSGRFFVVGCQILPPSSS